jgi:hypothetical protein
MPISCCLHPAHNLTCGPGEVIHCSHWRHGSLRGQPARNVGVGFDVTGKRGWLMGTTRSPGEPPGRTSPCRRRWPSCRPCQLEARRRFRARSRRPHTASFCLSSGLRRSRPAQGTRPDALPDGPTPRRGLVAHDQDVCALAQTLERYRCVNLDDIGPKTHRPLRHVDRVHQPHYHERDLVLGHRKVTNVRVRRSCGHRLDHGGPERLQGKRLRDDRHPHSLPVASRSGHSPL